MRYTVYRQVGAGGWSEIGRRLARAAGSYTDSKVVYDGRTYTYVVTATNGADKESPKSNTSLVQLDRHPRGPPPNREPRRPTDNDGARITVTLGELAVLGLHPSGVAQQRHASGIVDCPCAENSSEAVRHLRDGQHGTVDQGARLQRHRRGRRSRRTAPRSRPTARRGAPGLNGSRSGKTITCSGRSPDNGRRHGPGAGCAERTTAPSAAPGSRCPSPAGGRQLPAGVRAHTIAGWWTGWAGQRPRVNIPTDPKVTLSKGSTCGERSCNTGNGGCTSPACRWSVVKSEYLGWPRPPAPSEPTEAPCSGWRDMSIGANQTKESDNFSGFPGDTISVSCDGVEGLDAPGSGRCAPPRHRDHPSPPHRAHLPEHNERQRTP